MNFDTIIEIIDQELKGKQLASIRPGAEITITRVDRQNRRIELLTTSGTRRTRPFSELEKIWAELCRTKAVHVDSLMGGSGSSRNQPETIAANLPFVEWFMFHGKKHISYMGERTHPSGQLQQMDSLLVEELKDSLIQQVGNIPVAFIVVADDLSATTSWLESVSGIPLQAIEPGVYEQNLGQHRTWIATVPTIAPGTYGVAIARTTPANSFPVSIADETFYVCEAKDIRLMIKLV